MIWSEHVWFEMLVIMCGILWICVLMREEGPGPGVRLWVGVCSCVVL